MKKTTQLTLLFLLLPVFAINSFAQTNYFGVSGNMVAGDFDNDGLLDDIAAFNTSGELPVLNLWTNQNAWVDEREANFQLPFDFLSAKSLNAKIVSGDFDNDGYRDDIAAIYEVGHNQTSITVWINNDQIFTPQRWWYGGDFDANQVNQTVVVGDFDRDGFVDDIAAFYDYEQKRTKLYVWHSNGSKFNWPGTWWVGNDFNATRIQGTLVAGDFDQDGFQDDITALYDYSDDFCKAFVWTTQGNKFNWPYTWFAQADFAAGKAKGNVVSGDFDGNGFVDNVAALFAHDENSSSVMVFQRDKKGFAAPETWWYGSDEALSANTRLVAGDFNNNVRMHQFTGLIIDQNDARLTTWTAENNYFSNTEVIWQGLALSAEECETNGSCLPNELVQQVNLFPNPNKGSFQIEVPASADAQLALTVYNMLGAVVFETQTASGRALPLELNNLKSGSYLIQLIGAGVNVNQQFMVE